MKIAKSFIELVGNTPLVDFERYSLKYDLKSRIIGKIESYNPTGSVKDRIGLSMIEDGEKKGFINKGTVIIEPTSGNTGIGLAFVAAIKGYKLILTMPDSMSIERRKLVTAYGAEIVLTPGVDGMSGAIRKAQELSKAIPNSYIPQQFENLANTETHKNTTALEIWNDTDGEVDIVVAGVGTGGTITGIAEALKAKKPTIKIIAVEPLESAVISGENPGLHKLQGLGAGFIPKILNVELLDEIIKVTDEDAYLATKELARIEGILVGISAGAAVHAAREIAKREPGKNIVVIIPDTGLRYLSTTVFDD